ncbi:hypothetical protein HHK36_015947 [Tetracentron sinense]|uniref:Myb-like domain-containing protein n=1 Tax=Tetracentron sinense TaxID=13715 RepID=A0A834ZDF4_TETSI|nr:hypothetical protein HHK36_015947 [Tetracentron sinense]
MALERLSLAPASVDEHPNAVPLSNGVDGRQASVDCVDEGNRAPRLPRWTRQEILVLIQGKKVAESRVRRGRTAGSGVGSNMLEPKWASVSSYCKRHGVNRGPVQCRKRWSNLAGDFKKIKEFESQITEEGESFWVMRNDLRRERRLPGFFDREVYEILDGGVVSAPALALALAPAPATLTSGAKDGEGPVVEEDEPVFDSSRSAAAGDGLFSDFEQSEQDEASGTPEKETVPTESPATTLPVPLLICEKQNQPFCKEYSDQGMAKEKQPTSNPERGSTSQEGRKRRRFSSDGGGDMNLQDQLIGVLERNSRMLNTQLEAQNINCQLDRDQRKDHADSLVAVLSKLADALGRIADKL